MDVTGGPTDRQADSVSLGFIDRAMLVYLGFVTVVALTRLDLKPRAAWVIGANVLTALLIWLLHRPGLGRFGRVVRDIYPVLLLPALYSALDLLNGFDVRTWDHVVQRMEAAIFGGQVSREWWQASPSEFWSTLFHAIYFVYYFIVPFPTLLFLARGDADQARRSVALVVTTFLCCYVVFILFPVAGRGVGERDGVGRVRINHQRARERAHLVRHARAKRLRGARRDAVSPELHIVRSTAHVVEHDPVAGLDGELGRDVVIRRPLEDHVHVMARTASRRRRGRSGRRSFRLRRRLLTATRGQHDSQTSRHRKLPHCCPASPDRI